MKFLHELNERDRELIDSRIRDFVPAEVYDFHVHPYNAAHFAPGTCDYMESMGVLGCAEHRQAMQRFLPAKTIHGMYFGYPHPSGDRPTVNSWVAEEVRNNGTPLSTALLLVSPADDREKVAAELRSGRYCGIKVYHWYSGRPDTMNATVEEFAPEWMWELLHETRGLLMLHIVRDGAIADEANQKSIRRLCRAYPKALLVLAHIARSFNYRNARNGLHALTDLDNVVLDTSAICESEAFRAALLHLGPRRIMFGSDFAVSELRGRPVSTGSLFFWLQSEGVKSVAKAPTPTGMTLIGIESLLCLREACEDSGLTAGDLNDLFLNNALRALAPHLPKTK